jgi:hypothetical protein
MKTSSGLNVRHHRKKLQVECGTTAISLENADLLIRQYGVPEFIELVMGYRQDNYGVLAVWDCTMHIFTGFSWGYGGEGPRGLQEFFQVCNVFPGYHAFSIDLKAGEHFVVKH